MTGVKHNIMPNVNCVQNCQIFIFVNKRPHRFWETSKF